MWNRWLQIDVHDCCPGWSNKLIRFVFIIVSMLIGGLGTTLAEAAPSGGILSFVPSAVNFGSLNVGRAAAISFFVTNTGVRTVTISQVVCHGGAFSTTEPPLPYSLAPGKRLAIMVIFSPKSAGRLNGAIEFVSNAANAVVSYPLTGNGAQTNSGVLSATPNSATLGSVPVGSSNSVAMQLKNNGVSNITITGVSVTNREFAIEGLSAPLILPPGHIVNCTIRFAPSAAGYAAGSVSVASTAIDSLLTFTVSGSGVAASRLLMVSPSTLTFGSVTVEKSRTLPVTIKNGGNSNVRISNITTSSTTLQIAGGLVGATIAPGQTATLNVTFSPKGTANLSGSVTIQSNATDSPTAIRVSAAGILSPNISGSHSVNLNWQESNSSTVVGYHVYRSITSGSGYIKLDAALVSGLHYTDSTVVSGTAYYYVTTAVDPSGNESPYSNEVSAVIP